MPITYPLALPTISGMASVEITAEHASAVSTSPFTFQSQAQSYSGQRWRASVSIPPLPRADAEVWVSFLLKLKGRYGTFLMGDPAGKTARGTLGGTPQVNGASQTGSSLQIRGATPSVSNYFRSGDYIQLGTTSNSRLHKVLDNVASDSSGFLTVDIWPNLRYSPANLETIYTSNTVGRFLLSDNRTNWNINDATFYGITFDCEEAL